MPVISRMDVMPDLDQRERKDFRSCNEVAIKKALGY
uniref:Uncharacterized protein n=1 Tax=Utricularia reniformis TaxID=192314 RepID=A0A1Y0B2W6_9LAMI|nr:hypothetical protein AEK19_MT1553 [Utricularia reniformis]ART31740.1 hypothetical protein AEK19_MT1553 [Utricularia reniformis]